MNSSREAGADERKPEAGKGRKRSWHAPVVRLYDVRDARQQAVGPTDFASAQVS